MDAYVCQQVARRRRSQQEDAHRERTPMNLRKPPMTGRTDTVGGKFLGRLRRRSK